MTLYNRTENNGEPPTEFDHSQIFIGREQQLDLFDIYLNRWKRLMLSVDSKIDTQITSAPSPNNKIQGLIVLLYGRGGFGKTTLLKHYHEMALRQGQNLTVGKIVDWEFAIEGKRTLFYPAPRQEVEAREYYSILCGQLAVVLGKHPKEFKEYQAAVKDVEKARKKAIEVLDGLQKDDRYSGLRGLTVEAILTAIRTYVPGSNIILDTQDTKAAANEAAKITQEHVSQLYSRIRDKLGSKFDDYLEPSLRLGLALGCDLSEFAKNFPLLIFFDTYEEVATADHLLRMVMGAAGLRVGWVLAGRDNLWGGAEQRKRSLAKEYGYKDIVLADRALALDFNVGGVGAFTISDISEYFAQLCEKVRFEPPLPLVTEEGAERILDVTQGVPLAVKIAAALYIETADLHTVTEKVEGKREIVDQMVERYLLHAHDDQNERARLYGLALLRRADQPIAIAAALGLTPEEAKTSYASELSRLHRRYSFIFTEKEQPTLHQEVRHFLRLWLLQHRTQPEIVAVNERLKEAHETALKNLEDHRQYLSLRQRLEDWEWITTYLNLVEQHFWLDLVEGMRYCLAFMLASAIYRRNLNREVAQLGEFFEPLLGQPYHNQWKRGTQSLIYNYYSSVPEEHLIGLSDLVSLISREWLTFPEPLPDYRTELEAVLWWRLGQVYNNIDKNKGFEWYEKALSRLGQEAELREATARTAWEVSYELYEDKKYRERLPFLNRAIELKPDYVQAYHSRGITYSTLREYEQAMADFERAIELDPKFTITYIGRGNLYYVRREYEQAMAEFERAIELDPKEANAYIARGNLYLALREYEQAMADFNRAIELDTKNADIFVDRGNAYYMLKEYEQAMADYERAIELDPKEANAYIARGNTYRVLNHFEQAMVEFERAIELDPQSGRAFVLRGTTQLFAFNEHERAIEDFNHASELDPKSTWAFISQGILHYLRDEYELAIEDITRAVETDSETIGDFIVFRGICYYSLEEDQKAIEDLRRAAEFAPRSVTAYICRGLTYFILEEDRLALSELDQCLTINPEFALAYYFRGGVYYFHKEYKQAIRDFNYAITLLPKTAGLYIMRGVSYHTLGEYQRAIEDYDRAIEQEPKNPDLYNYRGNVYLDLEEYQHALADYDRAIELDPTDANTCNSRGNVYLDLKEYQRALADYDRAIELDPNYAPSYYNRGLTYLWMKDIEQARVDFRHRWELNQTNLSAAWMVEWIEMCQKRPALGMVEQLEKIAEDNPQDYVAYVCRGVALGLLGKLKDGVVVLEQAISLEPEEYDSYFWKAMLYAYQYLGENSIAAEALEKALTKNMPPVLLRPLNWLEQERPDFYKKYVLPLFTQHGLSVDSL